jgi:uncharacterized membrane protein YqjE
VQRRPSDSIAAFGLVLPAVTGVATVTTVATVLTPLAAVGLVLVMIGAIATHARRNEPQGIAVTAVLLILAALVAWERFGPYSL